MDTPKTDRFLREYGSQTPELIVRQAIDMAGKCSPGLPPLTDEMYKEVTALLGNLQGMLRELQGRK